MLKKTFDSIDSFCMNFCDIHEVQVEFYGSMYAGTAVVAFYDVIIELFNELMRTTDYTAMNIDISKAEWDGYDDEYLLVVGSDNEINIEKMKFSNGKYPNLCDFATFIHSDCNSAIITSSPDTPFIEFEIEEDGHC